MERQLHLFRSKRQRGVPLLRAKEYELHCMVADTLRRWCNPLWRYTHIPAGEKRDMVTAMRLKRMGVMPGWAQRLDDATIKQLSVYVHSLGGGEVSN